MFKKLGSLVLGIAAVFALTACTSAAVDASEFYVAVDINPSIEFIVDENDIVTSFNLVNTDAELLCFDVDFIGMNIADAIELFIEKATDAGFIDVEADLENPNAVLFTILGGDSEELVLQLQERIRERASRYFARNYINAEIFTEDFTQADLIAQATELGVSPGKLKLALLAVNYDETLTLEAALELPVKDLVAQLRAVQVELKAEFTNQQKADLLQQRTALMNQFQNRLQTHLENKAELTEDEIDALVNQIMTQERTTTRTSWDNAAEAWRLLVQERQNSQDEEVPTE